MSLLEVCHNLRIYSYHFGDPIFSRHACLKRGKKLNRRESSKGPTAQLHQPCYACGSKSARHTANIQTRPQDRKKNAKRRTRTQSQSLSRKLPCAHFLFTFWAVSRLWPNLASLGSRKIQQHLRIPPESLYSTGLVPFHMEDEKLQTTGKHSST